MMGVEERPQLLILLPEDNEKGCNLVVDAALARLCSSRAGGLRAEAAAWDLSKLLMDGKPVQRSTVIRWLDLCYIAIHGRPFEEPNVQEQPVLTTTQLYQLLSFADAIGSTRGLVNAAIAELDQLRIQATLNGLAVQLELSDAPVWFELVSNHRPKVLHQGVDVTYKVPKTADGMFAPASAVTGAAAEVAAQVEQLLFIARKLRLQELQQRVEAFITAAATAPVKQMQLSLPWTNMSDVVVPLLPQRIINALVYSQRVCEAGHQTVPHLPDDASTAATAAAETSSLHHVCLLGATNMNVLRTPILQPVSSKPAALEFKATVQGSGFAGVASDSEVEVVVDFSDGRPIAKITTTSVSSSSRTNYGGQHISYTVPVNLVLDNTA
jgi:hypothetical protein